MVLRTKLPLITISKDSQELDNYNLLEVPNDSEGSIDDFDFQSPPSKKSGTMRSKSSNSQSRAQRDYNRHQKIPNYLGCKVTLGGGGHGH